MGSWVRPFSIVLLAVFFVALSGAVRAQNADDEARQGRDAYNRWSGMEKPTHEMMDSKFDYADRAVRQLTAAKDKMLMSKVPTGKGGGGGTTSGLVGFVLRVLLSVSLVGGGLIAAAPVVSNKVEALAPLCYALRPAADKIGVVLIAVGGLCFVRALLFHFAPFTDLAPQAGAVLLGLVLAKNTLMRKTAAPTEEASQDGGDDAKEEEAPPESGDALEQAKAKAAEAVQAAQDLLIKNKDKVEKLEQQQVPLGLAALALGIVHLLLGGLWLF